MPVHDWLVLGSVLPSQSWYIPAVADRGLQFPSDLTLKEGTFMLTLYTAVGTLKFQKTTGGKSIPLVINDGQEYGLSDDELLLWSCLAFQIKLNAAKEPDGKGILQGNNGQTAEKAI